MADNNTRAPTITQHFTRAVIRAMEDQGLAVPSEVRNRMLEYVTQERIPMEVQDEIWMALNHAYGKPGIGLELGMKIQPGSLDVIGFLLLSCDTLEDALDALVTYHPLISEGGEFLSTESENGIQLIYSPFYKVERQERVEAVLSALVHMTDYLTGSRAQPASINISHAPIGDTSRYAVLHCPVHFNQAVDSIVFEQQALHLDLQQANPIVNQQMRQLADSKLSAFQQSQVTEQVWNLIKQNPSWSKDQVAEQLHVSGRHLNRLLSHEGTTYRKIADDVRELMAKDLIHQGKGSLDIAIALGFSDESSFAKAFKRWTGESVSQYKS